MMQEPPPSPLFEHKKNWLSQQVHGYGSSAQDFGASPDAMSYSHEQPVFTYVPTHCNTLQHTATHCNTLQHTTTHSNTLYHLSWQSLDRISWQILIMLTGNYGFFNLLTLVLIVNLLDDSCVEAVCVAVCCSVLQCVAVCYSVLQCVAVCCSVLQCVAVLAHTHNSKCCTSHLSAGMQITLLYDRLATPHRILTFIRHFPQKTHEL